MKNKGIQLVWITVKDLELALTFYTETVGLTLLEKNDEFGWAELSGLGGCRLGIAQENEEMKAGVNAVTTISVADIESATQEIKSRGATLLGDIVTIPEQIRMQLFQDADGNQMQLVQELS